MGERKVLNKYYPPDFDPSKIPKKKRPKNDQVKVRMMLPMSIRCNTCGEYLYRGKKFNSRKETVTGEEYLGIKIFRFYIKCTRCSAELTIKTDPKNSDYECEFGASRNFEPWRENQKVLDEAKGKRESEEMGDAMKALENRTLDSKIEMDILDALDEIRSLNARQSKMDPLEVLLQMQKEEQELEVRLNEEDEQLVKETFGEGDAFVKRIDDEESESDGGLLMKLELEPVFGINLKKQKTTETDNEKATHHTTDQAQVPASILHKTEKGSKSVGVKVQVKVAARKKDNAEKPNEEPVEKKKEDEVNSLFNLLDYNDE